MQNKIKKLAGLIVSGEKPNLIRIICNQFTWSGINTCLISQIYTICRQDFDYYTELADKETSIPITKERNNLKLLVSGELPELADRICHWHRFDPSIKSFRDFRLDYLFLLIEKDIVVRKYLK